MRIALVTHNVLKGDGQGRVNFELARRCLADGFAVTLVAQRVAPELVEAGAVWRRLAPRVFDHGLPHVWQFARLADRVVEALGPEIDLVVANGFVLRRPHAVNVCHFVHGAWLQSPVHLSRLNHGPYGWYQGAYTRLNSRWERQSFAAARTVVAVSGKVRDELTSIGVPAARIQVIHNGVDLDEFRPGPESRAALGLPEGVQLALFVGDIRTPRKNLDGVLRALTRVPDMHLAVVGELRDSPFPSMAADLGLGTRVRFLGFRRDVPRLMRASDVFAFPSRYEACSLALLEAMASGLPVVTAATAGGSELVTPALGHVLADPDDVAGIGRALRELTGPVARGARAAARAAAEAHAWSKMADEYLRLFRQLAAGGRFTGPPAVSTECPVDRRLGPVDGHLAQEVRGGDPGTPPENQRRPQR